MLHEASGKPTALMTRGIDTELFNPDKRVSSGTFTIGYVGRLSAEKNVRLLVDIHKGLTREGAAGHRFLIVGNGGERDWVRQNLPVADLPGTLTGEDLARAYASMDVFVFPSETDTFGNVVLEAQASGVPAVVSDKGGPRHLVTPGITGFVAQNLDDYVRGVQMLRDRPTHERMSIAARDAMLGRSWSSVFESVYREYVRILASSRTAADSYGISKTFSASNVLIQNSLLRHRL